MRSMKLKAVVLAITIFTMALTGCGKSSINTTEALLTMNGGEQTVNMGYGNFVARYNQANYDMYYGAYFGDDMWSMEMTSSGTTFADQVKGTILDGMKRQLILEKHAADYGVEITAEDEENISKAAKEFLDGNTEEAIEQLGATEEYVAQMLRYETLAVRVQNAIKEETEVSVSKEESEQKTISYVLYSTADTTDEEGNTVSLTDDEKAEIEESATALSEAEEFDAEAESQEQSVQTFSYTKSAAADEVSGMAEAVIKAANELEEGEVSEVIEVEGEGYYVVRLDSELDEEATEEKVAQLEEEQRSNHFNEVLEAWEEETEWEVNEKAWGEIKFDTLFSQIETETDTDTEEEE